MQDSQNIAWAQTAEIARAMGRNPWGQVFGAMVVAVFFGGLVWVVWHAPDFTVRVVAGSLAVIGAERAWRLLPIPAQTRRRWTEEERLLKKASNIYWILSAMSWAGIVQLVLLRRGFGWHELIQPAGFIALGLATKVIGHWVIQRKERGRGGEGVRA